MISKEAKSSMIFYSAFTFIACVFCCFYPLWVSKPISAFVYAMKNVASGNLEINIRTDKKDEVSEMSNQLQDTAENLEKVFMRKKFNWDEIAKMKTDQEIAMKEATESKDKALVALKAADEAKVAAMKDKESAVAAEKNAKIAQEEAQELALKIKKDNEETNAKVKDIQNVLTKVCAGDLTVMIPHAGEDAIGLISKNLNVLVQSFKSQIQELTTVVNSLSKMVHSIEQTNGDVINAQENTLNKVVIVSSASEEISSSIQTVSAATEEMKASISEISKVTHESNSLVSKTSKDVEHSAKLIDKLAKSSDGISSIIQIINSIASQTNLLALNATIEASRAGDAGKGFAVVAHEIKELAHQTQNATKSIEENINTIQDDSKTVISSIASMAKSFEKISEYSTHVSAAIEEQVSTSAEIGQSMMEASSGIEGVTKSMFEVKTLSETSSKSVHYSTLNLQEIAKMSKAVETLVNKYKIDNEKKDNLKMAA